MMSQKEMDAMMKRMMKGMGGKGNGKGKKIKK